MIAVTAVLVLTGIDWQYYVTSRDPAIQIFGFSAGMVGFLIPVLVPLIMLSVSVSRKNLRLRNASYATMQAGILGFAVSTFYKVFTGRTGLPHFASAANNLVDSSHMFRFGIYRGGAFQGWPSSHTSVAFAMSVTLIMLFPENKTVRYGAIAYALYIGLGASVGFHWLSDFVAGVILGTIIGITVGKSFYQKYISAK